MSNPRASWNPGAALVVVAWSLALCCVGASCSSAGTFRDGRFEDTSVRYRVAPPASGWEQVDLEQANIAWVNRGLGASLFVNSSCKGVQDSPLEALSQQLFFGMTDRELAVEERVMRSGREGLQTFASAKLDGVPRKLATLVLKKDGCVYDVVLDAAPEHFDAALPAFLRLRDGLDIEPRKDHEAP